MADSAPDTPQASAPAGGADAIQPYVDKAKQTIHEILEEPAMDEFLREHIKKIPEWDTWSEAARQAYAHMMTSQMLQRKAAATQIGMGQAFRLPDYSAIKNLGLLLQRKPLPPPPKKKRKKKAAPAAQAPEADTNLAPADSPQADAPQATETIAPDTADTAPISEVQAAEPAESEAAPDKAEA